MQKVLITTFTYPPNKDGVAEASRLMAEGLVRYGWDVFVATQFPEAIENVSNLKNTKLNGVTIARFDLDASNCHATNKVCEVESYLQYVKDGRFDLIVNQCWDAWPTTLMQPIFKDLHCPKVMVTHGYSRHIYHFVKRWTLGFGVWLRGINWTITKLPHMILNYDQIILLSQMRGFGRFFDHSAASFLRHPQIKVVPNGTHSDLILTARNGFRNKYRIPQGPMALCIANYCDRKNQKLTLRVFREANVPGSILVFIGSALGSYGAAVKTENEKLKNRFPHCEVFFLERLPREEVFSALIESELLILTAKHETQPIVLIEAMAAAIPWISTDAGCIREMEGGIVCRCNKSLVLELKRLLVDPALRAQLGSKGLEASRTKYSASACEKKYHTLFQELLKS